MKAEQIKELIEIIKNKTANHTGKYYRRLRGKNEIPAQAKPIDRNNLNENLNEIENLVGLFKDGYGIAQGVSKDIGAYVSAKKLKNARNVCGFFCNDMKAENVKTDIEDFLNEFFDHPNRKYILFQLPYTKRNTDIIIKYLSYGIIAVIKHKIRGQTSTTEERTEEIINGLQEVKFNLIDRAKMRYYKEHLTINNNEQIKIKDFIRGIKPNSNNVEELSVNHTTCHI